MATDNIQQQTPGSIFGLNSILGISNQPSNIRPVLPGRTPTSYPVQNRPNLWASGVLPSNVPTTPSVTENTSTTQGPAYPNKNPKRAVDALIEDYIRSGYDRESATVLANAFSKDQTVEAATDEWLNSDVYKQKFGWINEQRKKINPTAVDLSSGEIIDYYNQTKDLARRAGLPSTFWDNDTFAAKALAGDQSIYEISERIKIAGEFVNNLDPYFREAAREMGVPDSDMVAYALDPELGLPAMERDYRASQLLAETRRAGLGTDADFARELESAQITAGQAREASAQVARQTGTLGTLAAIEGRQALTEEEQLGGELGLNVQAEQREAGLRSRERARFSGTSAGTRMFGSNVSGSL